MVSLLNAHTDLIDLPRDCCNFATWGAATSDGPENPQNCPQDCASGALGQGEAVRTETPSREDTPEAKSGGEPFPGRVFSDAQLTRMAGYGDCYAPADFQPSTYYWAAAVDFGREAENSGYEGTISGEDGFNFQVMSTREGEQ